jgi:hypothetical protein
MKTSLEDAHELYAKAATALDEARAMPPGPARTEAMKRAGVLQNAADIKAGPTFARRGRPLRNNGEIHLRPPSVGLHPYSPRTITLRTSRGVNPAARCWLNDSQNTFASAGRTFDFPIIFWLFHSFPQCRRQRSTCRPDTSCEKVASNCFWCPISS